MADWDLIRQAIINAIPSEPFNSGTPPLPEQMFIPSAHVKSLQLYSNLVIGARGVGKSTWTSALADKDLRRIIGANIPGLEKTKVQIGFSESRETDKHITPDIIMGLLGKDFSPYEIWLAVILRCVSNEASESIPRDSWELTAAWVKNNPEDWARIFQKVNTLFKNENSCELIVFDALDRISDDWTEANNIVRDLLRAVIRIKAYSNICTKVFLREDQLSTDVTGFPDSSKLLSTKTELTWSAQDLHGLLWQHLLNAKGPGGDNIREYYKEVKGVNAVNSTGYWVIDDDMKRNETKQRELFLKLAGPWMGKDKRRGVPYVWSVSHLADGKKMTSPRSFLAAIRQAAEDSKNRDSEFPLYYGSINSGVQRASSIRINEIAEDYPWVKNLCELLRGKLNVPVDFSMVEDIWHEKYPDGPKSMEISRLPPKNMDRGWIGIKDELIRLGIFEEIRGGRINMPDLFRVGFGLGRKGGVTPMYNS
jgi:hypothetical protein